jgi:hypothetical protein
VVVFSYYFTPALFPNISPAPRLAKQQFTGYIFERNAHFQYSTYQTPSAARRLKTVTHFSRGPVKNVRNCARCNLRADNYLMRGSVFCPFSPAANGQCCEFGHVWPARAETARGEGGASCVVRKIKARTINIYDRRRYIIIM